MTGYSKQSPHIDYLSATAKNDTVTTSAALNYLLNRFTHNDLHTLKSSGGYSFDEGSYTPVVDSWEVVASLLSSVVSDSSSRSMISLLTIKIRNNCNKKTKQIEFGSDTAM